MKQGSGFSAYAVGRLVEVGLISPPRDLSKYKYFFLQQPTSWKIGDEVSGIYTDQIKYCNVVLLSAVDEQQKMQAMTGWHVSHQTVCFKNFQNSFSDEMQRYEELCAKNNLRQSATIFSRYNVGIDQNYCDFLDAEIPIGDLREMSSAIFLKISAELKGKVKTDFKTLSSSTFVVDKSGKIMPIPFSQEWSKEINVKNDSSPSR